MRSACCICRAATGAAPPPGCAQLGSPGHREDGPACEQQRPNEQWDIAVHTNGDREHGAAGDNNRADPVGKRQAPEWLAYEPAAGTLLRPRPGRCSPHLDNHASPSRTFSASQRSTAEPSPRLHGQPDKGLSSCQTDPDGPNHDQIVYPNGIRRQAPFKTLVRLAGCRRGQRRGPPGPFRGTRASPRPVATRHSSPGPLPTTARSPPRSPM